MIEKKNLYFKHWDGSFSLVCKCAEDDVYANIKSYILTLNPRFKIFYIRSWFNESKTCIIYDVGSHSEFFYWGEVETND